MPKSTVCSVVSNSVSPWTVAQQAPLSMEFSRQEYWRGLPFPTPGDLPHPGIEPGSLASSAMTGRFYIAVYLTFNKLEHIHSVLQPSPLSSSRTLSSPQKENPYPLSSQSLLPPLFQPLEAPNLFLPLWICLLGYFIPVDLYNVYLASFTYSALRIHPFVA